MSVSRRDRYAALPARSTAAGMSSPVTNANTGRWVT